MSSFLSIDETERRAAQVESCFAALYGVIGDRCRTVSDDVTTIEMHVFARQCGEWASSFRDLGPHRAGHEVSPATPHREIEHVLGEAFDRDTTGSLVLYTVTVEIIPPLLIALRDLSQNGDSAAGGRLEARSSEAATFLVASLHRITDVLRSRPMSLELDEFAASKRDFFHM